MSIDKEKIQKVLKTNMDLMERKNNDYSNLNLLVEGPRGVVTRLVDKVARLRNLFDKAERGEVPNFESIMDTFGDVANYGMIGQLMQEGGILNNTQKVFILNDELSSDWTVIQCRELEDGLQKNGLSFVGSIALLRGMFRSAGNERGFQTGLDLKKQMILWADAVVVMHGLSIKTARLVEYAVREGKKVIIVGEEENSENTAGCICCNDAKKALSYLTSGGLNG